MHLRDIVETNKRPEAKYLLYGYFSKINIMDHGTDGTTYKYLLYGHFPKINISYQVTLGAT